MPSAPLAITSQTRKKLKTCHFDGKTTAPQEDKENHISDSIFHVMSENHSPHRHELRIRSSPSTPACKIPLADLIGNTEDAFNCPPAVTTPNDHVIWQHGPRSSDLSNSVSSTQRRKKRSRSSSPPSSQMGVSNHFSVQKETLNLQDIHKSLRTPQNDPSVDLWNRYANGNLSKNEPDSALPTIARIGLSSPQTPSTTNSKDSTIRRTVSCGIEWPTSKAKRRRVEMDEPHGRARNIFAVAKREILAPELPKASRVSILVEKIHESLSKRPVGESNGPPSSSPLPDRHAADIVTSSIPVQLVPDAQNHKHVLDLQGKADLPEFVKANPERPVNDGSSSEFGDDDIDIDFVEGVELAETQKMMRQRNETTPAAVQAILPVEFQPPQINQPQTLLLPPSEADTGSAIYPELTHFKTVGTNDLESAILSKPNGYNSEDEFGEDDMILTEMEDLVAQYDSQQKRVTTSEFSDEPAEQLLSRATVSVKQQEVIALDFEDEFNDDEIWDNVEMEQTIPKSFALTGSTKQKNLDTRAIKRYLILDIVDSQYDNEQGRRRPEKMLSVKDEKTKMLKVILLRQSWYETRCTKGSYIHLIGEFDHIGQCVVSDTDNMIILHPDHLISATVVADSFTCTRRAVLQDRVKATAAAEKSQVFGHILHEVFGEALRLNDWQEDKLRNIIMNILPTYLESLYEINISVPEAVDYLMGKMPELRSWASVFVSPTPGPNAVVQDRNGALASMSIEKLLETEEHIWSPMYGLKGNIDATIQVAMQMPGEKKTSTLTVPLEFKTGKRDNNESHRAQTALYTLLLSDRYDINVTCGVLYYLETSKTFRVEGVRNELRQMIIQRNELACYVHDKLDLPPMIKREHMCKRCYAQTSCFTYHKLIEDGDGNTSGMKDVFNEAVKHLKPIHQEFFKKWDGLLTKEERDTMKFRRELWTMLSKEREVLGRCFANVVIEPGSAQENKEGSKINRFQYTFVKHKSSLGFSFTESQLTTGEPVVVSDEHGHFALANGFVTNVRPHRITVAVDRRLHNARHKGPDFNPTTNQTFTGIMEVTATVKSSQPLPEASEDLQLFRLDKDEFSNGMATARNNIIRLMEKDLFQARELRQLIIEAKAPQFKPTSSAYTLSVPASQASLNVDQRRAIEKVMSAQDYALVLGMPGTGKTTTIAHIIRALVSQNKSVLLTSYTHTAVDNILLKIKDDNIPTLRLGAVGKIHAELKNSVDLAGIPKRTIAELENSYVNSKVVASTCLGVNHPIFNARIFDYCIVDEASQITLPVCLGPIRMARTFILVGDHYQLPPLVQNKEAQEGGLDISLFKQLSDAHPEAVVNLEHQYRMAEDVQLLANTLIYEGRLKCGTLSVAKRALEIPDLEAGLMAHHHTISSLPKSSSPSKQTICLGTSKCYLRHALAPANRVVFLNTDTLGSSGHDSVSGSRITNPTESLLTAHLITTLIRSGVAPCSIGAITFYRSQLAIIRQDVKATAGTTASQEVEMHTADKFQGRDKEVMILSCVRSNESNAIGELLKDWRRVNVAVTRARSKLILVGSKSTLGRSGNEVLEGLVRVVDARGWVVDLSEAAVDEHNFGYAAYTQTQRTARKESRKENELIRGKLSQTSPSKNPKGVFRKPAKVVKGTIDLEKLLDSGKRPVMRDIINGI